MHAEEGPCFVDFVAKPREHTLFKIKVVTMQFQITSSMLVRYYGLKNIYFPSMLSDCSSAALVPKQAPS